jgi:hypothetical protein
MCKEWTRQSPISLGYIIKESHEDERKDKIQFKLPLHVCEYENVLKLKFKKPRRSCSSVSLFLHGERNQSP